jgi:ADP-ribose pyrophosphatase YjhB (NUDIX family)
MHPHPHDATFKFCPVCGGSLASRRLRSSEPERLVCTSCGYVLYLDPKVAVGTIIRSEGDAIVLLQRAIEPGYGQWVFPGGYVDRGEELIVAALREAREETNLDVRIDGLINVYSYGGRPHVIIVYAATALGGSLKPDEESLQARWFQRDDIPWSELAFPSTRDALTDFFRETPSVR